MNNRVYVLREADRILAVFKRLEEALTFLPKDARPDKDNRPFDVDGKVKYQWFHSELMGCGFTIERHTVLD